jgi:protein-disulfide isomerase
VISTWVKKRLSSAWYNLAMEQNPHPPSDEMQKNDQQPGFSSTWNYYLLVFLMLAAGIALGYIIWGRQAAVNPNLSDKELFMQALIDDDPSLGPIDAPVTIVEFSDFECPYCRQWHQEVWPQIEAAYNGKVRLIFRDFPLTQIHSNAMSAAIAANCAAVQNKYWEYHDLIYKGDIELSPLAYEAFVTQLNMNLDSFTQCQKRVDIQTEIQQDMEFAGMIGVEGTPTFFVNGYRLVGAQPFEEFKKVIDTILSQ